MHTHFQQYNYESFYPQKLAVERLDKYGYKPWGNKKQILGELPEQWQAEIVEDGDSFSLETVSGKKNYFRDSYFYKGIGYTVHSGSIYLSR